jgi:hypothetical protein
VLLEQGGEFNVFMRLFGKKLMLNTKPIMMKYWEKSNIKILESNLVLNVSSSLKRVKVVIT